MIESLSKKLPWIVCLVILLSIGTNCVDRRQEEEEFQKRIEKEMKNNPRLKELVYSEQMSPESPASLTTNEKNYIKVRELESDNSTVKLTVFYESLCPDSIDFFNQQLRPAYLDLSHNVKLDLVPYGFAKQNYSHGRWTFTCQHGPKECDYNKIHACAIKLLKQDSKIYRFISCLMKDKNETLHLSKCATMYKVNLEKINKCRLSKIGDRLLSKLGNRTDSFRPKLKWVPTVAFNDVYTKKDQDEAMKNLAKVLCRHLKHKPRACHDHQ